MHGTITQEDTFFGTKSKLALIVRTKIGPTSTPKSAKGIIVWFDVKKTFIRSFMVYHLAGE
jgi:hypothetical protein